MEVEYVPALKLNVPEWYARKDFQDFLNHRDPDLGFILPNVAGPATWHRVGSEPGEFSDVFMTYEQGHGSDTDDLPEDIYNELVSACERAGFDSGIIWLTNVE